MRRIRLLSVQTNSGFLENAHVTFSPKLTCLIGTRGKVAVVRVNELRIPIIVKVASGSSRGLIEDEAKRFHTFIADGDRYLQPEIHLHGNSALMIFGLIESNDDDQQPAPTLDEILKSFWYSEMRGINVSSTYSTTLKAVTKAIYKTARLNKQKCPRTEFACKANPYLEGIKIMENNGFDWGFSKEALKIRSSAEGTIETAFEKAVAHGDLHARNVLLRGEDGFTIDYAYSGPGHPCTDLVRLELSLFFSYFTVFVGQKELVELQRDFTRKCLSMEQLIAKHPNAIRSEANRLCLAICVIARDSALEVLASHDLKREHYSAMKVLTAWQSLQVATLQRSLVRVVVEALSDQ